MDKRSEEALDGDDSIILLCCLLKAKIFLSEGGRIWLRYVCCECGRDSKELGWGDSGVIRGEFMFLVTR